MSRTPEAILTRDFPPKDFDVAFLAEALGEPEPDPQRELAHLCAHFGPFATWRLLQKTLDQEARGGLMITNQSRRRTPGGTFFWLARQWCDEERRRPSLRYWPPIPTIERTVEALPASLASGECVMKTTLMGTPGGAVVDRQTYGAFKLSDKPAGSLPKGLPPAPKNTLSWSVMVGKKQWSKVETSRQADPKTKVMIEGYPCQQGTALVLWATNCMTTAMQAAKRVEKQEVSA
jgi:hypothetical protein